MFGKTDLLNLHEASELPQEMVAVLARGLVAENFDLVLLHLAVDVAGLAEQAYLGVDEARGHHFNQGLGLLAIKLGRAKMDRAFDGEVLGGDV